MRPFLVGRPPFSESQFTEIQDYIISHGMSFFISCELETLTNVLRLRDEPHAPNEFDDMIPQGTITFPFLFEQPPQNKIPLFIILFSPTQSPQKLFSLMRQSRIFCVMCHNFKELEIFVAGIRLAQVQVEEEDGEEEKAPTFSSDRIPRIKLETEEVEDNIHDVMPPLCAEVASSQSPVLNAAELLGDDDDRQRIEIKQEIVEDSNLMDTQPVEPNNPANLTQTEENNDMIAGCSNEYQATEDPRLANGNLASTSTDCTNSLTMGTPGERLVLWRGISPSSPLPPLKKTITKANVAKHNTKKKASPPSKRTLRGKSNKEPLVDKSVNNYRNEENEEGQAVSQSVDTSNTTDTPSRSLRNRISCSQCHISFTSQNKLNEHIKTHATSEFHCSKCGRRFSRSGNLKKHESTHKN